LLADGSQSSAVDILHERGFNPAHTKYPAGNSNEAGSLLADGSQSSADGILHESVFIPSGQDDNPPAGISLSGQNVSTAGLRPLNAAGASSGQSSIAGMRPLKAAGVA